MRENERRKRKASTWPRGEEPEAGSGIRLRSVAKEGVRLRSRQELRPYLPRGSVGAQTGGSLGTGCSSCDERTQKQKGPAARRRLEAARRQREKHQEEKRPDPT